MIRKRDLVQMREHIFAGGDDLCLDNCQARYAIEALEAVDRMVEADLIMGEEPAPDDPRTIAAENAFDKALGDLLTTAKAGRERLRQAAEGTGR